MTDGDGSAPTLTVVATPIGNLGDLTPRARDALFAAEVVACEDTRRTSKLLADAPAGVPSMVVVNEHTEFDEAPRLVERILGGDRVVLVSDAGTPGVSDPGLTVIRAAIDAGIVIDVLPGASAVTTALVASGLDTSRFTFEGFLPRRGRARAARLAGIASADCTSVIYEAPGRTAATLDALSAVCGGQRSAAVCRELTKLHQEVRRGTLDELVSWAGDHPVRGEVVLVVDRRADPEPPTDEELAAEVAAAIDAGMSRRDAAASIAARHGVSRREVYELSLTGQ